jgi:hypothetical protein
MDHEQRFIPNPNPGSEHAMSSSPASGSARQLARKQGLARMSAVTLGVGAAGVLGAVAIAVTLPQPVAAHAAAAASTSVRSNSSSDGESSDDHSVNSNTGSATTGSATSQLKAGTAPSTTSNPPAATSGGS